MIIAHAQNLSWLLVAAVPLGFGAGAVDAGLNGYVARHYTGRHMNWLHACWGIGATCGPIVMAHVLATGAGCAPDTLRSRRRNCRSQSFFC